MRALVIGGSGFIGTRLVAELRECGHEVRIFDKQPSTAYRELVTIGDVRDRDALIAALSGMDVVYNLAAEHRDDVTPVSLYYDVNVEGTRNIVAAAELNGVERIVFTSTVAVYGLNRPDPDEQSPVEPFNDYGRSKLEAEKVLNAWADRGTGRSLVIVRPVVIFGERNQGNVYNLISQIERNKFMMVGLGDNRKSMAYVGNVAKFLVWTLGLEEGKHLINFANKPDITVRELITLIRSELGMTTPLRRLPYPVGLVGGFAFDILSRLTGRKFPISSIRIRKFCANTTVATKALEATGFTSPFTLQEGFKRMIATLEL